MQQRNDKLPPQRKDVLFGVVCSSFFNVSFLEVLQFHQVPKDVRQTTGGGTNALAIVLDQDTGLKPDLNHSMIISDAVDKNMHSKNDVPQLLNQAAHFDFLINV